MKIMKIFEIPAFKSVYNRIETDLYDDDTFFHQRSSLYCFYNADMLICIMHPL